MSTKAKFTDALPGALLTILISVTTTAFIFFGQFSSLQTKVEAQSMNNKETIDRVEKNQTNYNVLILNRLNDLDKKIDDIRNNLEKK